MIKLIKILNELQVVPQGITVEKVEKYYIDYIWNGSISLWDEYEKIKKKYLKKYDTNCTSPTLINKLSKPDLIQFYKEIQVLVQKYS